ncbi:histone-arginine methyltransferase CARM1-like [Oncorhynchus masou masou]|uniref:histone-arginine methyltransferase CARM1-like n=1 Tax=Oncorhynchus masou masou TaxID=90313 RepID=UPI00318317AD
MAVSVFPGVRLLSIGDANGEIQRHSEQQPLRLEVKATQDAAMINLSNAEETCVFKCSVSRDTEGTVAWGNSRSSSRWAATASCYSSPHLQSSHVPITS